MIASIETLLAERESAIERLRHAYGFSECEARDFLDSLPVDEAGDSPVDSLHLEQAA